MLIQKIENEVELKVVDYCEDDEQTYYLISFSPFLLVAEENAVATHATFDKATIDAGCIMDNIGEFILNNEKEPFREIVAICDMIDRDLRDTLKKEIRRLLVEVRL